MARPLRAVRDPRVIAAWRDRCDAARRRGIDRIGLAWLAGAIACLAAAAAWSVPWLAGVGALCVFASGCMALVERGVRAATLRCPHCGEVPFGPRESPHYIEFCRHCYYWLKPPF